MKVIRRLKHRLSDFEQQFITTYTTLSSWLCTKGKTKERLIRNMIRSKKELNYYLQCDKVALNITRKRPHLVGDYVWKFQIALRKAEYYSQFASGGGK